MLDFAQIGRTLLLVAGALALLGLAMILIGRLGWPERLIGDIEFKIGNVSCVFSLGLSLLLSVGLTLLINLLARLLR